MSSIPTPMPAVEPEKADIPMSDTVLTPNGQSAIVGHDRGHGCHEGSKAFEAALFTQAGDHRSALQIATEGRFNERAHADTLRSFTDLERQNGERFATLATQVKEEAMRTREMIQAQKIDDLRMANLRLELAK